MLEHTVHRGLGLFWQPRGNGKSIMLGDSGQIVASITPMLRWWFWSGPRTTSRPGSTQGWATSEAQACAEVERVVEVCRAATLLEDMVPEDWQIARCTSGGWTHTIQVSRWEAMGQHRIRVAPIDFETIPALIRAHEERA